MTFIQQSELSSLKQSSPPQPLRGNTQQLPSLPSPPLHHHHQNNQALKYVLNNSNENLLLILNFLGALAPQPVSELFLLLLHLICDIGHVIHDT